MRVGVQGGGCGGFAYSLNFDTNVTEKDRVSDFFGVKLAVEKKFDPYLDGTVVDFYDGLEKRGFRLQQPQRRQVVRLRQFVPGLNRTGRTDRSRRGGSPDDPPLFRFEGQRSPGFLPDGSGLTTESRRPSPLEKRSTMLRRGHLGHVAHRPRYRGRRGVGVRTTLESDRSG